MITLDYPVLKNELTQLLTSNIQKAIELTEFENNKNAKVMSNKPIAFSTLLK